MRKMRNQQINRMIANCISNSMRRNRVAGLRQNTGAGVGGGGGEGGHHLGLGSSGSLAQTCRSPPSEWKRASQTRGTSLAQLPGG